MRAALAQTLAVAGEQTRANQILGELVQLSGQKYVSPYFLSGIYLGLGQQDRAIDYLEKAHDERSHWLLYLHIDPSMDSLRSNPGFQDLLRRVGLPL
jgi:predicted Zn-dependent protease